MQFRNASGAQEAPGPSDLEEGIVQTEEEGRDIVNVGRGSEAESPKDEDSRSIRSVGNQTNFLSTKRLMIAIPALSVTLFVSFIDTTSVATSIPAISAELDTGAATSWIGSSFLVASTSFQLINGRLSDIFGRKNCLLLCLALLGIGDIGCGFSTSKEMLFVFRSLAGIGGGGINSLTLIIVSDIVTLENRGKYQGIMGAQIAFANGIGPFIGGALVDSATWRWVFWIVPMLALPTAVLIYFFLPLRYESGNYREKLRKIDYVGILLNLAAVLLILVPLSGGGVQYAWNSPLVITMLTIGSCIAIAFVLYEWKAAAIPIMPIRLVKYPYCIALYAQNFFSGLCFYGEFFYLPIYFQSILGHSALKSGALLLAFIGPTSLASIVSGQMIGKTGRYLWVVVTGFLLWTIGAGLKCDLNQTTRDWHIVLVLMVEGLGTGFVLQPTFVAILANSRQSDRAVATGLRNFIRTIGGAFGLVISGAILSNTLDRDLSHLPFMTREVLRSLTSSTYSLGSLDFSDEEKNMVLGSYMTGIRYIYILYVASIGLNLVLCVWIGNTSLKSTASVEETEQETSTDETDISRELHEKSIAPSQGGESKERNEESSRA